RPRDGRGVHPGQRSVEGRRLVELLRRPDRFVTPAGRELGGPGLPGSVGRARAALRSRDFRLLLGSRFVSQLADGAFQAYLIDRLVFLSPDKQSTAAGVAKAFALLVIPFSLI